MNNNEKFFSRSVIVTGTHYSMSTLIGRILAKSYNFKFVHEPLNAEPTLGYAALDSERWYEYYDDSRYAELKKSLIEIMNGNVNLIKYFLRVKHINTAKDIGRTAKYLLTMIKFKCQQKRAVFKDPFMVFSARHLQHNDGLFIVLCVRHPCAFAESIKRRTNGFEFKNLLQPSLLKTMPDLAQRIEEYAEIDQPLICQAALLWRVVYEFADIYYRSSGKTITIRQEDFSLRPNFEIQKLFSEINADFSHSVKKYVSELCKEEGSIDFGSNQSSYIKRNPVSATNKWKVRLSEKEIEQVLSIVGNLPQRYGY